MKIAHMLPVVVSACALFSTCVASAGVPWGSLQSVDLRSFLHGEAPPPPKAPPPKQVAIVSTQPGTAPDMQIERFIRDFANAIMARDGKPMLTQLAEKYGIDDLPADKKPGDLFVQAIERIPGATEIVIRSIERNNDIRTARIEFRYGADNIKVKTFRFDVSGKLLWSDLFVLQRQRSGA